MKIEIISRSAFMKVYGRAEFVLFTIQCIVNGADRPRPHLTCAWVKVFRIIPEFRILRLTFHRKSASKC